MWVDKAQERERVHPCNVCDKASKSLSLPYQHKVWQHRGHAFDCKGCCKKFNPNHRINKHKKLVCENTGTRGIFLVVEEGMQNMFCSSSDKENIMLGVPQTIQI